MDSEPATVLVVDDTPENIDLLVEILKDDYKVKAARNGAQGLKIARLPKAPDLILLDIMMPDIDGFEVARQLKGDPTTCDIPIIFVTAKITTEDEIQGFKLGAVDFDARLDRGVLAGQEVGSRGVDVDLLDGSLEAPAVKP